MVEVKVRLETDTVPSEISVELMGMVTSAVGAVVSRTLKCAVPPSVVVRPDAGITRILGGDGWP